MAFLVRVKAKVIYIISIQPRAYLKYGLRLLVFVLGSVNQLEMLSLKRISRWCIIRFWPQKEPYLEPQRMEHLIYIFFGFSPILSWPQNIFLSLSITAWAKIKIFKHLPKAQFMCLDLESSHLSEASLNLFQGWSNFVMIFIFDIKLVVI